MLKEKEILLAVVRNIEQWDFELFPKFSMNENEARAVADVIEPLVAQQMLEDYQKREKEKR